MKIKGTIVRLFPLRGFGFINGDDGQNYFLHVDNLSHSVTWESLLVGQSVEFLPATGGSRGNGLRARDVVIL